MTEIRLRTATLDDAVIIFEWRNVEETRRYFFDPKPLEMADHLCWFKNSLLMPTRWLLIAEQQDEAIGVLRFDTNEKNEAEIGIYVKPGLTGKGLGTKILEVGCEWVKLNLPHVKSLVGKVIPENVASCRAFEKSGFRKLAYLYERTP